MLFLQEEQRGQPGPRDLEAALPVTVYTWGDTAPSLSTRKSKGQEPPAPPGGTTVSERTAGRAGAASSRQAARPTRRPPPPRPLLAFALLFRVVICLELAGRNKYILLTPPPRKHIHLGSLRPRGFLQDAGFGALFVCLQPRTGATRSREEPRSQTPPQVKD